jgi:hypothetical protein
MGANPDAGVGLGVGIDFNFLVVSDFLFSAES